MVLAITKLRSPFKEGVEGMWPVWLLDIDGVVNADPGQHQVWPEGSWVQTTATGSSRDWPIVAATPVIEFIRRVHEEKWAEIIWLSTWRTHSNNVSKALGLPNFRYNNSALYANKATRYAGPAWWKMYEALMTKGNNRPVIWTDDDISDEIRDIWGRDTNEDLLISPRSKEGLAPVHLIKIAKFLRMPYEEE